MAEHYCVMISSTYEELKQHRAAVSRALLGHDMFPLDMANDASLPQDLISASLAKVDKADAYIGLISYRYGQIVGDPERNRDGLSLTELEFRHAVRKNIPRCMFIMSEDVAMPRSVWIQEAATANKLAAFIALARKDCICAEFRSVEDLEAKVGRSLADLQKALAQAHVVRPDGSPSPAPPPKPAADTIPAPPAFCARPPYIPGCAFQGRVKELATIRDWAGAADPVMLFEAIGGMGKSMVTWEWIT